MGKNPFDMVGGFVAGAAKAAADTAGGAVNAAAKAANDAGKVAGGVANVAGKAAGDAANAARKAAHDAGKVAGHVANVAGKPPVMPQMRWQKQHQALPKMRLWLSEAQRARRTLRPSRTTGALIWRQVLLLMKKK